MQDTWSDTPFIQVAAIDLNRGKGTSEIEGKGAMGSVERQREPSEFQSPGGGSGEPPLPLIREIRVIRGVRMAKKSLKKRLHKRRAALYKCGHEHPTPQYFTGRAGCTRPGDLAAAKRDDCPRFLARARHAGCAGR